jgi:quercetin dioxygenase-like cupin family protein
MSSTTSNDSPRQDTFWWQGSVMEIKARAEDTGGALGVLEGSFFEEGYGPPIHVHSREDEVMYVLDGQIRFRVGDDEFVADPGTWVWQPRGVPHSFRVESEGARALVIFMPGGIERMFEDGGVPAGESAGPPQQEYDLEAAAALAKRYGFEVVGPQLA